MSYENKIKTSNFYARFEFDMNMWVSGKTEMQEGNVGAGTNFPIYLSSIQPFQNATSILSARHLLQFLHSKIFLENWNP